MADLLQTVDLSTSIPARWTLVGFSGVKSDGVNPFRVPAAATQVKFETAGPRYVRFQLQLWARQDITSRVSLDGKPLGEFHFPAGQFVNAYPSGFVGAGQHTLQFEQSCAQSCEIHQYHAEAKIYATETASRPVGYKAQGWWLNAPDVLLQFNGLSAIQFDGTNFYRAITTLQPATIVMPAGVRPTNLHYLPQNDKGGFKLHWTAEGKPLAVRVDGERPTEWATPRHDALQNVPLITPTLPQSVQVRVECQGGGSACLPVRLYWTQLTGVPIQKGLTDLSAPKQALSVGLAALVCVLAAWLLRPWQGRQDSQGPY